MAQGRRAAVAMVLLAAMASGGCAARWAHRQGNEEARKGNWDLAVARFTRALQKDPDNIGYKISLENARIQASRQHYDLARKHLAADDLARAVEELEIASKYDPSNKSAADDLVIVRERILKREAEKRRLESFEEVKARAATRSPLPVLSPRSKSPISLKWDKQSLQKLFETLGKLAGVNILFDEGFRDKTDTTVNLVGVTFQEALDQLTYVNRLFYKVLDQNTVIIIPESQAKRRQYDDILLRTFYIQNAELKEIEAVVKTTLGAQARVASNPTLGALTITGSQDELALAERVIELNDKTRGEVVVEITILEVNRAKLKDYGIELSNYRAGVTFAPHENPPAAGGGLVSARAHLLASLNLADFIVTIPSAVFAQFLQTDNNSRVLAAPRLRAAEGKKTSLKIGTEIAIPVTTFQIQQQGAQAATSFQTRNVGVNLEVTPRINASGDITLELAAEFSLLGDDREVSAGLVIPDVRTRNVNGIMRLRDGETTLLGGLVLGSDVDSLTGPLGLNDVPLLNRVLGSRSKRKEDNEILISITPHLVRAPKLSADDLVPLLIGTREVMRVPSLRTPLFGPEEPIPSPSPGPAGPEPPPGPTIGRPPGTVSPSLPRPGELQTPAAPPSPYPHPLPTPLMPSPPPTAIPSPSPSPPGEGTPPSASIGTEVPPGRTEPAPPAAPRPAEASFSPPELRIKAGESGTVGLVIVGGQDLTGVDLLVSYDGSLVDALDVSTGPLLTLDGSAVGVERGLEPGRVRARFTRTTGVAGSGVVAIMTFRGLKPGTASVKVDALSLTTRSGSAPVAPRGEARIVVLP